jgi:hypothetical protein
MRSVPDLAFSLSEVTLSAIADQVARSLATTVEVPGAVFIQTPLSYPSGTSVVVRLSGTDNRFFVSDFGRGFDEVSMFSSAHGYSVIARNLVQGTSIGFDSRSFFVAQAEADELVGVVGAIANCSQRAVIETVVKHEARKYDADRIMLFERLESAFGKRNIEHDVMVRGSSMVDWEIPAKVVNNNVISLFDYARHHRNPVSSTVAKFHDLARLEPAPRRIVSIRDFDIMGSFVALLSQAAHVIEIEKTSDEALRKLAA